MKKAHIKKKEKKLKKKWTVQDSKDFYRVTDWGQGFFSINEQGHAVVRPYKNMQYELDLSFLVQELMQRDINTPVLLRFTDILKQRVKELYQSFRKSMDEASYKGEYMGVYPIKVNQSRQVVEDILDFGKEYNFGLESGSKAELLIAVALMENEKALIICNGYKDQEYIETALLASKIGKNIILVVEKLNEMDLILSCAKKLNVEPTIGVRCKLSSRGAGKWEGSGGEFSKFGLTTVEILQIVQILRERDMLHIFKLLHFHLGSQITAIRSIKEAMGEAVRIFSELYRLGAPLNYFDVGGGLAIDYDGSKTNFASSANYSMQEYAADIVWSVCEECERRSVPHPHIISESGRALVAHHSVLLVDVTDVSSYSGRFSNLHFPDNPPDLLIDMKDVLKNITIKNYQESFHDAMHYKDDALARFNLGLLNIEERAIAEDLFWQICVKILKIVQALDYIPEELSGLERFLADTYICNFSVFQSLPDHWAIDQLFPIMPISRLDEQPDCKTTLVDITCDSDGKIEQFIDLRGVKDTLSLHYPDDRGYHLGIFLIGAYQEILGDLHNLFGDTNTVHVSVLKDGNYIIDKFIAGDTVGALLRYVQYDVETLINKLRNAVEAGVKSKKLSLRESAKFLKIYQDGLNGYSYLEKE